MWLKLQLQKKWNSNIHWFSRFRFPRWYDKPLLFWKKGISVDILRSRFYAFYILFININKICLKIQSVLTHFLKFCSKVSVLCCTICCRNLSPKGVYWLSCIYFVQYLVRFYRYMTISVKPVLLRNYLICMHIFLIVVIIVSDIILHQ